MRRIVRNWIQDHLWHWCWRCTLGVIALAMSVAAVVFMAWVLWMVAVDVIEKFGA